MESVLTIVAIVSGFASAGCWLRSTVAKVTDEQAVAKAKTIASRTGKPIQFPTVAYNGLDPYETLVLQSKWNAAGALFAAIAVGSQAATSLF